MNTEANSEFLLPNVEVARILAPFGARASEDQLAAISRYAGLLLRWNKAISLTTIDHPAEIIARHFGESIFATHLIPMNYGRLADVGTGAGFPGMALKIASPGLSVTLIESNRKKCAFLAEVQRELGIVGVEIMRNRYEDAPITSQSMDFICARAVGNYGSLLRWANNILAPRGRVLIWIGLEDSILISKTLGWAWELPVPIPDSARRVLLVGRPRAGVAK
jgi:16S rRNA (guanine527-N7)-methyltransferase